jgi:hypothetical protein
MKHIWLQTGRGNRNFPDVEIGSCCKEEMKIHCSLTLTTTHKTTEAIPLVLKKKQ